jgi:hypothetical protein
MADDWYRCFHQAGVALMQQDACQLHLTADQCRQRAKLVRNFAKGVSSGLLRQDLLDIAAEYERRAESTEADTIIAGSQRLTTTAATIAI